MGALTYDGITTRFDDRLLAHLQIVIVQRLRQNRGFLMSWLNALEIGDGRTSIWIHQYADIRFTFDGSRAPRSTSTGSTSSPAAPTGHAVWSC